MPEWSGEDLGQTNSIRSEMDKSVQTVAPELATATLGQIRARLDRLPMTRHMWVLLTLLALGGFFELYDLYFTGYIAPGLFENKLLTPTTTSFFSMTGLAGFLASVFIGLFIGTILFGFVADRFGRRTVLTASLLWCSAATIILAFQTTPEGLNIWRLIGGIGIGGEMVTIDSYLSKITPLHARGKRSA
jgi:putative MFS transporter